MRRIPYTVALIGLFLLVPAGGKSEEEAETPMSAATFAGLAFRELGPAIASGRIGDIAVHPKNPSVYFVAAASGGVWKTENAGTTWTPVFDDEGSYSIGCITVDVANPLNVWVGTGENNSQRSVSYGDGVYKSTDGGTSWSNVGLAESEHVGKIVVDPRDSDRVWVAAQGPLWRAGGDRGLYRTTDGGESWELSLEIDGHTGVTDVVMDPRNSDLLLAASYQRRRRTWTLIDGGPGSGIHKTVDGGESWTQLTNGLPSEEMGRIGLALSPAAPDTVYAIIESIDDAGGFFRSTDAGANWSKRSDYVSGSPQYYQELVPDPLDPDRVYSMDTWMQVTEDGGLTFRQVPETSKHVDNHALWIDPEDTTHLRAGCDGGVYESFDRGETWRFFDNLPITQFYKIAVDDDRPFYNVYGGTQDNSTLGGPSRTASNHGILNRDWFVTVGGDGFKPQVDRENPDIVYSQWQYGNLVRYDRRSGEIVDIQPQEGPGDEPLRWNWDAAFIISPHANERLYFAAQRVFRSDDRGDSWRPISGDLTRQLDRNALPVMGKVWSVDAVAKNRSTSFFGNVVSLTESPFVEGLLYAGSDDGLVQVTEDGGATWRSAGRFPEVPEMAYVSDLEASLHDTDTVFAAVDNHKSGDFAPYLLESSDRGATWRSIAGDLPERGSVYSVAQDPVRGELLFAGTEFGAFFSADGGIAWIELGSGMPVIAVRDLVIQERAGDLVAGTFGRGIYVLDDYAPLRQASEAALEAEALLFPARPAAMYMESFELGYNDKAFQGDSLYAAPNPPLGALLTYYLKESAKTRREARREREAEIEEEGGSVSYPDWEELRLEDREREPEVLLTVTDEEDRVVRRLTGPVGKGIHRVAWDLRYPPSSPVSLEAPQTSAFSSAPQGPMVAPGTYRVHLSRSVAGAEEPLAGPMEVVAEPLGLAAMAAEDREAALAFQRRVARLQRATLGAVRSGREMDDRIAHLRQAARDTPGAGDGWTERLDALRERLEDLRIPLTGDRTISSRSEPTPPSIVDRVQRVVFGQWSTSSAPTATQRRSYEIAADLFAPVLGELRAVEGDMAALEAEMEAAGAPWTPGRVPQWQPE